jgi:hypothetical protein
VRPALDVMNSTHRSGLAASAADDFRHRGWSIAGTGNYPGGLQSETTVYYASGESAAAHLLASQFPGIDRVVAATSSGAQPLLVVLGADWTS